MNTLITTVKTLNTHPQEVIWGERWARTWAQVHRGICQESPNRAVTSSKVKWTKFRQRGAIRRGSIRDII